MKPIKSISNALRLHGLHPQRLSGFTLVEVIVSLLILGIATTGLLASFVAAQRYVSHSRHRLAATNAARIVLEDFRRYVDQKTWNDPANNPLAKNCPSSVPCSYALPADYQGTPWNWSANYVITPVNVGGIDMRRIDVTVHWDESNQ